MANICAPALFCTIKIPKGHKNVVNLVDYLVNIGRFVEHLELWQLPGERIDNLLVEIVKRCPNLRCLTITHSFGCKLGSSELIQAIMLLPALTSLSLMNPPDWLCGSRTEDIIDSVLEPLLGSHGDRLRSLKVDGDGTLGTRCFALLTRDVPRLVELELWYILDVGLRRPFAESSTWACAAHLQSLAFVGCGGLQANVFTQMLASGVFGHPQRVSLSNCGSLSDDEKPPGPIEWTIPALDTFKLDYPKPWEMEHLQLIHAKKVFLSQVWGPDNTHKMVIHQLAHKRAFPEATEVHVTPIWCSEEFSELLRVCSARGVREVTRDWDRYNTTDNYGWFVGGTSKSEVRLDRHSCMYTRR